MSGRATAEAPSNIAFVKYWGTRDLERTLPYNPSISMTLSRCVSRCTVERRPPAEGVEVLWRPEGGELAPAPEAFRAGVERHLRRLAATAGVESGFRVATANTFPTGAGIASSASGFAALAVAATAVLGLPAGWRELSARARESGSGSAARSTLGGYVEWPAPEALEGEHAAQLHPAGHWALSDLVAVVDASPKRVSSRDGHRAAPGSPYFARRLELLPGRLDRVRRALARRDMTELGPVIEEEALDLHLIAISSRPPIHYWRPGTLAVLEAARELRAEGVEVWATIDAGPNVHLICETGDEARVEERVAALPEVERLIVDRVGEGPRLLDEHLV
ncbi:MAG: diphosphomevalonate decarboxylase [Thermoanaerobaculia bacterium]|nr:diphosphomevalonate decarboxylase [Thermoanaerobaculia bacterium]